MEIIIGILIGVWLVATTVATVFIVKNLAHASININVNHANTFTELPFDDIYDNEGDEKQETTLEDTFNEVFKEFNELMTGEEMVKSDG